MAVGPDILSDTMGVDFGPYMRRVIAGHLSQLDSHHP